jgi:hypothetical protein
MSSASLGIVKLVTLVNTSGLLASGSETTGFTVLVNRVGNPVVSGIVSDGSMAGVDENDLEVLIGSVLVDPVTVQHTQVAGTSTDALLGCRTQRALVLELVDTLVSGLTVSSTLRHRSLAVAASHTDSENDKALLGLVSETTGLVGAGRSGCAVDNLELTILPAADAEKKAEHIRLLLAMKFFKVFVGTHCIF